MWDSAPELGFRSTLVILAGANIFCSVAVLAGATRDETQHPPVRISLTSRLPRYRILWTLFFTGLLGIGYEVLVVRVMSQVLENTVYTFASILSVYLFGTALGAALYQRCAPRHSFERVLSVLLQGMSFACLFGIIFLWTVSPVNAFTQTILGRGFAGSIIGELASAFVVFFLPTLLMGAVFSHLAQAAREQYGIGHALGINTLGASFAPLLFGVVLLPLIGSKMALILVSIAYMILITSQVRHYWKTAAVLCIAAIAVFLIPAQLQFVSIPPGGEIVTHMQGVMANVSVIKDTRADLYLKVNNHFAMGGTGTAFSDRRQAHIPLLLHRNPKTALFLGLGTGTTFAAASMHKGLIAEGVELIPEVVLLMPYFVESAKNFDRERMRIVTADARRFVKATPEHYDVIVADLFHPSRDGAGSLYTVEHFEAIRSLLQDRGLFCQWLPLYQLDMPTLRTIIRTFLHVFPNGQAFLAHYSLKMPILGLIVHKGTSNYSQDWYKQRVRDPELINELKQLRLDTVFTLLGGFLASKEKLQRFAGKGCLNTDNHPIVTYQAPRFVYSEPEPAYRRVIALIDELKVQPGDLLGPPESDTEQHFHNRLFAYWKARDQFLRSGVGVSETSDVNVLLAETRESLLSVVRMSSDFSAAYNPLLAMAFTLYQSNPSAARTLLTQLETANPSRHEARLLRHQLFGE